MRIKITEDQKQKLISELSKNSAGVKDFIEKVKNTPGLLKHLGFNTHQSLEHYILDGSYKDFKELKKESETFEIKKR